MSGFIDPCSGEQNKEEGRPALPMAPHCNSLQLKGATWYLSLYVSSHGLPVKQLCTVIENTHTHTLVRKTIAFSFPTLTLSDALLLYNCADQPKLFGKMEQVQDVNKREILRPFY